MIQEPQSKAWIVWVSFAGVIIAAIIGLGMPFAENLAARYLPPLTPTPEIETNSSIASIPNTVNNTPITKGQTTSDISQAHSSSMCFGKCWEYDENAHTMTWTGSVDGTEDIWQPAGDALRKVRAGYTSIITTSVPGEVMACVLSIDGNEIKNSCDGVLYQLPPGTYRITSPGENVGGFRWCPEIGYGWRVDGGECR